MRVNHDWLVMDLPTIFIVTGGIKIIREICQEDISQCVKVIRTSFATVAESFGITEENAPRFTAFSTDEGRIYYQLIIEPRPMYGYFIYDKLVGFYSLFVKGNVECELNNLCVIS